MKPAWQTTEFWLNLVAVVVGGVASSGVLSAPGVNPVFAQVAGLLVMVLGALGHTASRTILKHQDASFDPAASIAEPLPPTKN